MVHVYVGGQVGGSSIHEYGSLVVVKNRTENDTNGV
jgi:hypothetical protein